ncbi:MAG TPA: ABC transporter ATP-binding protein [Aquabacterium sp.]|nr:ABC transporter ATP-binding protein [Aquabacterium sp.]HEX5371389.1 ABC transporter ATP-binding protein [Aquabacterium sp.]
MAPPTPVIEIQGAEQVYPNGTRALQPVSLSIAHGEFLTLLGPSGCGKSTLLKMIAGLLQPTGGHMVPVPRQALSFVFQEPTLMPWARVEANVRLPLDLAGVPRAEGRERARQALARVGLASFEDAWPRELSGGMQMRVSIARALVTRPSLLLMDEPFGALDDITRQKLDADLLTLWQQEGLTVVFVTHSIAEAVALSTRVVVMGARPGRVVDDVRLRAPDAQQPLGPEDTDRTSARFNERVRQLQHCLARASEGAA